MTTAPEDFDRIIADLGRGLSFIDAHADQYIKRRDFYDGTRKEVATSDEVAKLLARSRQPHTISLAHVPVDALVDKIELNSVKATGDAQADAFLAATFEAADLQDEADDWHTKAGYFGDYYVIVDIAEEDEATGKALTVTPIGSSPLSTVVIYDKQTGRTPLYGVKRWQDGRSWRALVYYDDVTVKLVTDDLAEGAVPKPENFERDMLVDPDGRPIEGSERVAHVGGKMLIVHYAVDDKPYGRPLHEKAFGPQDAITKVSAVNLANVDGQGFGARWALADPMAEADDDIDDDFGTDGPTTKAGDKSWTGNTEPTTGAPAKSKPGAITMLRGIKSVGEFAATSSDDFIKNLDWYIRVMAVACRVPMFEFDPESGAQISGIARLRAEAPLTRHAKKVARAMGSAHETLGDTIVAVAGFNPETAAVVATFRPTEVSNDLEGMQLISAKVKAGVPIAQAFTEAGYTPEQIEEWFPKGDPNISTDQLQVLAAALQQLGQAMTLGVISAEDVQAMLPTILTGVVRETAVPVATDAAPLPVDNQPTEADQAKSLLDKTNALGQLIRSGADPEAAAERVGLPGLTFPNVPVTVRIPEAEAVGLEGSTNAPAAPATPDAPTDPAAPDAPVPPVAPSA